MPKPVRKNLKYRILPLVLFLLLLVGTLFFLHNRKGDNIIPSQKTTHTQSPASSPQVTTSNLPDTRSPKTTTSGTPSPSSAVGTDLQQPSGAFVSTHHPKSTDQEASSCFTTPGASCYIEFSDGTETKRLQTQTVSSSDGSAYWSWSVSDAGLSPGHWQVSAVASLNGQTKTTTDETALEIQ
jgi:hypothetical protein